MDLLCCKVNDIVADVLATLQTKASAALIQGVWKSRASRAPLGERNVKKKKKKKFPHLCNTCIDVINFYSGSNFLLEILVISSQKKPANHDLYAFRRTKTAKWSGEPNDLKVVLGEQQTFSDSLPWYWPSVSCSVWMAFANLSQTFRYLSAKLEKIIRGFFWYKEVVLPI